MAILDRPADPLPLKQQSSTLSDSSVPVAAANNGTKDGPAANIKTQQQARNEERAERAAKLISLASLLLLFVAVALYTGLSIIGWNPYIAAVALFSAGLAGYPLLILLTHAVASQTSRSFTRLGPYDRFLWAQKGPSMLHAVTMSLVGLKVAFLENWSLADIVAGRNELVSAFLALELAYLFQDLGVEVMKQVRFGRSMHVLGWLHHIALLIGLPFYYTKLKFDAVLGLLFLCNAATVPRQLRWYFQASGMPRKSMYRVNSAILILSFVATHILSVGLVLLRYCQQRHISWRQIPSRVPSLNLWVGALLEVYSVAWLVVILAENPEKPRDAGDAKKAT